jgi:hypothetical protein
MTKPPNPVATITRKHFPSIPEVIKALDKMAKQLANAKSFEAIKKIEQAADVGAAMTPIGYERSRRSWSACNPTSS